MAILDVVIVRTARSFIEQADSTVTFGQAMRTSRNSVSTNVVLKFGQTLVLSGLTEQEVQRAGSGDVRGDDWSQPARLEAFSQPLGSLLYY